MVLIARGWGRRPVRPDRIEWTQAELDAGHYTQKQMEIIADYVLRDAADQLDSETGKRRGLRGVDPILFDEHIYQRRRREILNKNGVPDPEIQQGSYWKAHPEGRKINSPEARAKGAGWYR